GCGATMPPRDFIDARESQPRASYSLARWTAEPTQGICALVFADAGATVIDDQTRAFRVRLCPHRDVRASVLERVVYQVREHLLQQHLVGWQYLTAVRAVV